ncbi:MAG: transporter substrate-binding domain-containing protein [Candidatus Omnitrophica bacterium]|nr:transporter substrate-binding domain-containing protein [Candidatus Omnitrophota bacterium]
MKSLCVGLVFLLGVGLAGMASAETITVAADPWMPYTGEAGASRLGYCVDVVKAIYEPAGYTVEYQTFPWSRDVADVAANRIDAIIGASRMDCPTCLFPDSAIGMVQNSAYVAKGDTWKYAGVSSLAGRRLGVVEGYSYDDGPLDAYIKDTDVPAVRKSSGTDALQKNIDRLVSGRLDVVVENDRVMKNALDDFGWPEDSVTLAGTVNEEQKIFLAFAPDKVTTVKLMRVWTDGIRQLRSTGKLKEIMARYHLADWEISSEQTIK